MTKKNAIATPSEASTYSQLLRHLSEEHFYAVVGCSPRQAKEAYFSRLNIRAPKSSGFSLPGQKNAARLTALREFFLSHEEDGLAQEILRRFLLARRTMLAAALDHLNIPHEAGLTESPELSRLGSLAGSERAALIDKLVHEQKVSHDDVTLYLDFIALEQQQTG